MAVILFSMFWGLFSVNIYKEKSNYGGSNPPKFGAESESEDEEEGSNFWRAASSESDSESEEILDGKKKTSPEGDSSSDGRSHHLWSN